MERELVTLFETFRTLAAFRPERRSLIDAPWDSYVGWAITQGLAPLAAYNVEYVLAGAGAPEWAREQLLSVYQGTLNDNVMKLVHFKRTVGTLEGRRVVVLGAAALSEALYPHMAFRPIEEIQLLVQQRDLSGLSGFLRQAEFLPEEARTGERGAAQVLSDGRTEVFLHTWWLGGEADEAAMARALPVKVYGPSVYRLDLEDAVLALCLEHARRGYVVPWISLVDLRELLLGAPELSGPYSRPPRVELIRERAKAWRLERALYASTTAVARLFPETAARVQEVSPHLRKFTRTLLDRWVVDPLTKPGRVTTIRGADRLRRLLTGGRA